MIFLLLPFLAWSAELAFQELGQDKLPTAALAKQTELARETARKEKKRKQSPKIPTGLETKVAHHDLNNDGAPDLCVSFASYALYGSRGATLECYIGGKRVVSVVASPEFVDVPGSKTQGVWDLAFSIPGESSSRLWKWDGEAYR